MPGFVKTQADEKKWAKAKRIAKEQLGSDASEDKLYSYANAVFHSMKGKTEESVQLFDENKLALYSQFDYMISNLTEEEMWHTMKGILAEHPNFNVDLEESEQYTVLEYLYKNYKNTINENEFGKIEEYLDSMLIPNAMHEDIQFGVLEEDYISGGFGGLGAAEYGYGGVGYAGGRSRRRGFGGPRQGGQMNRRATGNPNRKPAGDVEEPAVVNISDKKSTYKPWEVELTPDGQNKRNIERNKVQSEIDDQWDSELGAMVRGLESAGLDMDEFADMSQEEIENVMIKKLTELGKEALGDMEQQQVQEAMGPEASFSSIIDEAFSADVFSMEEALRRSSRIQDAREILASKHNYHKAIEKEKDRSYTIDQYGIDKLMRKFGYIYDENNFTWIKKSKGQAPDEADDKLTKKLPDDEEKDKDKYGTFEVPSGDDESNAEIEGGDEDHNYEDYDEKDFDKFEDEITDPVKLESKLKPLMARFILSVNQDEKTPTEFTMNDKGMYIPKIEDEKIFNMMDELKYDWDPDKDIWVDDSNTLPVRVFDAGEDRRSLSGRSYLAAMGELPAIQFDVKNNPLFTVEEVSYRMGVNGFVWDDDINKWTYHKKDLTKGAETLNESVLRDAFLFEEAPKQPEVEDAINKVDLQELQARYLYRAAQIDAFNNAPKEAQAQMKVVIDEDNPTLFGKGMKPENESQMPQSKIEQLLSEPKGDPSAKPDEQPEDQPAEDQPAEDQPAEDQPAEDQPADEQPEDKPAEENQSALQAHMAKKKSMKETVRDRIVNVFYEANEDKPENVKSAGPNEKDANGTDDENIELDLEQGDEEDDSMEFIGDDDKIIPQHQYEWNKEAKMWLQDGNKFPEILEKMGESPQSFSGRPVLAKLQDMPQAMQISAKGKPNMSADKVLSYLEGMKDINWFDKGDGAGVWIKGEAPVTDPDEISWLGKKMMEEDMRILNKWGKGYNKSGLKPEIKEKLRRALIGQSIIKSGTYDENEWYDFDHNITDKSDKKEVEAAKAEGRKNQDKLRKKFDRQFKVVEKEIPEEEKPDPMSTHKMVVKKRIMSARRWMKAALGAMWNIGKRFAKWSGKQAWGTAKHAALTGMMVAASMDGYQGPYKFLPNLTKSEAWSQYQKQRQERYYQGLMGGGNKPDTGSPSRTTKPK